MRTKPPCRICDEPIHMSSSIDGVCRQFRCLSKAREQQRREDRERSHTERYDRKLEIAQQARRDTTDTTTAYTTIVTPANKRRLVRLPRRRRYRFVRRLIDLIKQWQNETATPQCVATAPIESVAPPELPLPVFAEACTNCRGRCCRFGGTNALLDTFALQQFQNANPTATADQMLQEYARYLPETSYKGSCVFHSANGCELPRQYRSRTCNNSICGGLVELKLHAIRDGKQNFFLAAMDSNSVIRARCVEI